jgi:hypothetical protein
MSVKRLLACSWTLLFITCHLSPRPSYIDNVKAASGLQLYEVIHQRRDRDRWRPVVAKSGAPTDGHGLGDKWQVIKSNVQLQARSRFTLILGYEVCQLLNTSCCTINQTLIVSLQWLSKKIYGCKWTGETFQRSPSISVCYLPHPTKQQICNKVFSLLNVTTKSVWR